jgi:tetratricopeptide (TPR) repeat protein
VAAPDSAVDFFVSHADADVQWAEWIAAELENAGYGVILKAWDFRPGENSLTRLDEALTACRHAVCVLSPDYADSEVAARTAALRQGLEGKERALIPVRVADCPLPPLLGPIIAIDLSGVDDEGEARQRLLAGVADRVDRVPRGGYPGTPAAPVRFPGIPQEVWELRGRRPVPYFTGRDEELAALRGALRSGSATAAIQVITGLGGIGKSCLAVEYAYRYASAYDLVWWIRAEDRTTLRSDYAELAQALGLPSDQDDEAVASLRQELRRRRDWLLVFDNAEDPEELFRLLPDRHSGHVLVTTQRREWPHAETRRLGVLSAPAAVQYLQQRGKVADAANAAELADALGRLPLMVAQAASVIADGMPAADYLNLLGEQSPELFAEGRTEDNHVTVDLTWRVSVDRLAGRSPAALALFRLAAFLNADAIPLTRLKACPGMPAELADALASPIQLAKATRALSEYSLAETGDGLLSVHRMVQAVTRTELGEDERSWSEIALTTISAAFPHDVRDPKNWDACEAVLTHALTCAEHAIRLDSDTATAMTLLNQAAVYLLARGRTDLAGSAIDQALAIAKPSIHDDPVFLSCRNTYGQVLLARGDLPAARAIQEEVYRARTDVLGPEDLDTLRAGRDLVEVLYRQGNANGASQLQDRLVEAFTSVLGPDDLETVTSRAYQATLLRDAGQYARARAIEEQVAEARSRVLGPEHPQTLAARANLATTLGELGELGAARAIEEQVAEALVRVLGPEHPHTLAARGNLASTLGELGELGAARAMKEQVAEALVRVLGPEHPDTLTARGNLAGTLGELGELGAARAMKEQVAEARSRVLGPEHPQTLAARANLAATLHDLGELDNARRIQERVAETRSRLLGPEHLQTLAARANLAATLHGLGDPDSARAILERVAETRSRVLGPEHPQTLAARANLAATLRKLGEPDDARAIEEEIVAMADRTLGGEHRITLQAKTNLAATLSAQGNMPAARSLLNECLAVSLRAFGKEHSISSVIAWNLANTCGPHEQNKRRIIILQNLSWLSTRRSEQLSAEQRKIKDALRGSRPGGAKGSRKPR